jgi:hypothetical protein
LAQDTGAGRADYLSPGDTAKVLEIVVDELDCAVVQLRHAGWQSKDDHSFIELDTDEEYAPPRCVPVWEAGSRAHGLPDLEYLEGDDE